MTLPALEWVLSQGSGMIYATEMSKSPKSPRPESAKKPARKAAPKGVKTPQAVSVDAADTPAGDRIAKVLSRAGVASRREAERMIAEGLVAVNGKVIDSPALNVTAQDKITVKGEPLPEVQAPRLWLYHKPAGLVTTTRDELGRKTIFDELPEGLPRVMTVGRLDLNSEGLLLLTNDGGIKRKLELPSTGWLRRYRVRIKGRPQDTDFEPLRKGLVIEGERFQPMTVSLDRQQGANAWLTVGLREGKNREIRRAMEDIGFSVNRLLRLSYGPFQLGDLKPGEVEELRGRVVRDQLGLDPEGDEAAQKRPSRTRRSTTGKPGSSQRGTEGSKAPSRASFSKGKGSRSNEGSETGGGRRPGGNPKANRGGLAGGTGRSFASKSAPGGKKPRK